MKESKSWLTLSRQKDDTRQSAPEGGKNSGDNGKDWCTSTGSTSDTTKRRRVAFSAQADELEKIKKVQDTGLVYYILSTNFKSGLFIFMFVNMKWHLQPISLL